MTTQEIHTTLKSIISNCSNYDVRTITSLTDFYGDIGYDSLDMTDLIIQVEKAFDITIKTSDMRDIETYQDVYDVILKELQKNNVAIQQV